MNSIIEMHATWIAVNSIVGCTNGCHYCFLKSSNKNLCKPKILKSSRQAIDDLINSKYYLEEIPVCLLPNTDAFLNQKNILYLKELMMEMDKKNLYNPIIIITKCAIPLWFIEFVKKYKERGHNVIIYLSLSGLPNKLEPNVNHDDIKRNFVNLHNAKVDIIHYYRPITPLNSGKEQIEKMLNFVSKYSAASVIGGLKIKEDYFYLIKFWPELMNKMEECIKADSVWPIKAYEYFYKKYKGKYSLFQTNYCALMKTLNKTSMPYYMSIECQNCNLCPPYQRKKCKNTFNNNYKEKDTNEVIKHLKKIGYKNENIKIQIKRNIIKISGIELNISDISYLTYALNSKIVVEKSNNIGYWNSAITGSLPLVI